MPKRRIYITRYASERGVVKVMADVDEENIATVDWFGRGPTTYGPNEWAADEDAAWKLVIQKCARDIAYMMQRLERVHSTMLIATQAQRRT